MMQGNLAGLDFDSSKMEAPADNFDLLPAGWYAVMIVDSEYGPNSKGNGNNLKLVHEITGPKMAGRKLFDHLSLDNPNMEAVRIAGETLKKICDAVGFVGALTDSSLLHDKPFMLNVGIKNRKDNGEPENIIKQYKPYDASRLAAPAPGQAAAATAAPTFGQTAAPAPAAAPAASNGNPPWMQQQGS